jgi:hypothetical protein
MNKRNKEQLKAAIGNDLVQGQGDHSATRALLRQYAPLEGIISKSAPYILPEAGCAEPVENSLAPHATVAPNDSSPWHGATVAQDATVASGATVARYAEVKGELRVPNTINFSLFPTLDPFAKAVYYQLYLLSHGFKRDRCIIGLAKLATAVLMSLRKVQDTVTYLEKRGLIKRLGSALGGMSKGNIYQVMLPAAGTAPCATVAQSATLAGDATLAPRATLARGTTVARHATNKDDDDKNKKQSSSKGRTSTCDSKPVENHRRAAAPRERQDTADGDFALVRTAYEKATGNRWNKSDSEAYNENGIKKVPVDKIISVLEAVVRRTPAKVHSFNYFVKEIVAIPDLRNRAWQKKRLEKIVRRIRDGTVGRADYSAIDFLEDVKCACAREGVRFDDDIFNELVG